MSGSQWGCVNFSEKGAFGDVWDISYCHDLGEGGFTTDRGPAVDEAALRTNELLGPKSKKCHYWESLDLNPT